MTRIDIKKMFGNDDAGEATRVVHAVGTIMC